MMNVVSLMAGSSQSFFDAGYAYPKMLIEIVIKYQPFIVKNIARFNEYKNTRTLHN